MMIKSKKTIHGNFACDENFLEKVSSYKYLGIDIAYHLNWNYNTEKSIMGGWKAYYALEKNCKVVDICNWSTNGFSLRPSSPLLSCMVVKSRVAVCLESLGERLR